MRFVLVDNRVLCDTSQLAEKESERRARQGRQYSQNGIIARLRDQRQHRELHQHHYRELAVPKSSRDVSRCNDTLGQYIAEIQTQQRLDEMPSQFAARHAFQAQILKSLRITRA